jgi:hypothetical protein
MSKTTNFQEDRPIQPADRNPGKVYGTRQAFAKAASPLAQQLAALGSPEDVAKREVQQYSTPTQFRDAQGKTLPQYRMGIGHRILGTLANFANGFAGNHIAPLYVGRGALNNRYYQDERVRQQNLEGAQRNLDTLQGRIPTSLHDVIDYKTVYRDGKGTWKGRTYGGQVREGIEAPAYEASPDEDDDTPQNQDFPVQLPQTGVKPA